MLKIAICDDDVPFCYDLENKILSINKRFEIDVYFTLENLVQKLDAQVIYDLLFLDIEFGSLNGISIGKYIREVLDNDYMQIVFVSSKTSYAMDLFEIRPLHFLIKPLKIGDIAQVINKTSQILDRGNEYFIFPYENRVMKIKQKKVMYFASLARKVFVYIENDNFGIYEKIDDLQKQASESFIRIHQSYLINYDYIKYFYYDKIQLTNLDYLPISQSRRIDVRKKVRKMRQAYGV